MTNTAPLWIQDLSRVCEENLAVSRFFTEVKTAPLRAWLGQLAHQSSEFTRALSLRSALCRDATFTGVFAEHAAEEAQHPAQLEEWMRANKLLGQSESFLNRHPSSATIDCMAYCWRSAVQHSPLEQIAALNLVSECAALTFYTNVIPVIERQSLVPGRYWKVHREVDSHHMWMGVAELGEIEENSLDGATFRVTMLQTTERYRAMLDSWL